ncbi:MAG: pyridoxal phosphate-dependent aminotransferase [Lachnospiraceae bacterium]|nr:pyridoxal phosphate-dependent aminotransferase [Lachnospiraceae bacterium]
MKYNFDEIIERRGTNSYKWNVAEGELPMWVADMDFKTAPEIRAALQKRLDHGIFGYEDIPDEWYSAYQSWWERRHHFKIEKDWLVFCTGVIPAISTMVRKLSTPAEKVVVQTPVYNIFFNSIVNNGRQPYENRLIYDEKTGRYKVDWEDLEKKLADPQTSLFLLCNPHNPSGEIWTKEALSKIGALCKKYGVTVISDEIHCDITDPGTEYVPFASASEVCKEISVSCIAPTKCFNIAGTHTAAVFAADPFLRHKVWRGLNTDEVAEPNSFAMTAAISAFNEGEEWLEELRKYVAENKKTVREFIMKEIPKVKVMPSDATYLLWLNIGEYGKPSNELAKEIREKTGLYLSAGDIFGGDGENFLRMNTACPRAFIEDGLERLKKALG